MDDYEIVQDPSSNHHTNTTMNPCIILITLAVLATAHSESYPVLNLPRIDINKYANGNTEQRAETVSLFKQYLHQFGAITLMNHDIPNDILNQMEVSAKDFFSQSEEYKTLYKANRIGMPGYEAFKSFTASKSYTHGNTTQSDYNEMFTIYNHKPGSRAHRISLQDVYYPLNNESQTPKELYAVSNSYLPQIRRVLSIVNNMASEALLGLNNTDYFDQMYETKQSPLLQLRFFNYPEIDASDDDGDDMDNRYGLSEHYDYLGFGLFRPGKSRGLQHNIGGKKSRFWIDIETGKEYENDIFLHCGEIIEYWTNGYWPSVWHRVTFEYPQRLTHTYFSAPGRNVLIKPIHGCAVCNENEPKYAFKTVKQHRKDRYYKEAVLDKAFWKMKKQKSEL
eukprot:136228_1